MERTRVFVSDAAEAASVCYDITARGWRHLEVHDKCVSEPWKAKGQVVEYGAAVA